MCVWYTLGRWVNGYVMKVSAYSSVASTMCVRVSYSIFFLFSSLLCFGRLVAGGEPAFDLFSRWVACEKC